MTQDAAPFTYRAPVRYYEVDQQGVVFNSWYLAYMDEAMTAFIQRDGTSYQQLLTSGVDFQLVHTELDWQDALRYGDVANVDVALARLGRTSFTVQFAVRVGERPVATASTVYVVVATDGSGPCPPPPRFLEALGPVRPLRH
ncbi:MAG: acyl-CoA thioesterase [Acidimicrobiales bacterium]